MLTTCPVCDRIKVEPVDRPPRGPRAPKHVWAMPASGGTVAGLLEGRETLAEEVCPECEAEESRSAVRAAVRHVEGK